VILQTACGIAIHKTAFISRFALVMPNHLEMEPRSYLTKPQLLWLNFGSEQPKGSLVMIRPRHHAAAAMWRLISPFVPARKQLPFLYWLQILSGDYGPDLTQVDRLFANIGVTIDVGANEGLFTYRFSKKFRHVYAFEISPDLAAPITQYNPGNITPYSCGLSSTARAATLHIPVTKGFASTGWGSIDQTVFPDAEYMIEKNVLVKSLDDFGITGVDFIKIDVEGHELEVLKGAATTIKESHPILLVEVQDDNLSTVSL
jgi:FkbM family methyltransferase